LAVRALSYETKHSTVLIKKLHLAKNLQPKTFDIKNVHLQ